jgi:hypothetical protein
LLLECLEDRTVLSTVTWINAAGGDWDTAANWMDTATGANRLPTANDDAVISQSGITVTHSSPFNADEVHSLTSAANLNLTGGSLTLDTASTANSVALSGPFSTLSASDILEVKTLNQSGGTLTGSGTVIVDSALLWTGGTMSGTGSTEIEGGGEIGSGSLSSRTLDNFGSTTVDDGTTLNFSNNALLNNHVGATLTLLGSGSLGSFFGASGQVENAGTLIKTGADNSTATVAVALDNTGMVDVQHGTLNVTGAFTNEGTLTLEAGAVATLGSGNSSGTFTQKANSRLGLSNFTLLTGASADVTKGAELDINGPVTQQGDSDVTVEAGGLLNVAPGFSSGPYTLSDGAVVDGAGTVQLAGFGSQMVVNGAASITNLVMSSGSLTVNGGANLDVQKFTQTGGTLTGRGTLTVENSLLWTGGTMSGPGRTVVNGTTEVGGTGGTQLNAWTLDNFGNATVDNGASLNFTNSSAWINEFGSSLTLLGSGSLGSFFGASGQVNNAGTLIKTGASDTTATVAVALDNTGMVDVQHGTLNVTGAFTNEGTLTLEAGAVATLNSGSSSGTFTQKANSRLGLSNFTLLTGATADVAGGAELDINGPVTQQGGTDITLESGGLLNVAPGFSSGPYTLANGAVVDGAGTVQLAGFSSQMVVNGSVTVSNVSLSNGTLTVNDLANLDAQNLTQTGGTLTGRGTVTVENSLLWTGGTMSGPGQTIVNGTGTIGSSPFGVSLDSRTFSNNGNVTLSNGTAIQFHGGVWVNQAGGTLILGNGSALGNFFGNTGTLTNFGLVEDTSPTSQASIGLNSTVTNHGVISLQGVLNVSGGYTQASDGTLTILLSPGNPVTNGSLRVSGQANLDGTLNVSKQGAISPTLGETFTILTFNGVTGDFATFTGLDLGNGQILVPGHSNTSYTLTVTAS